MRSCHRAPQQHQENKLQHSSAASPHRCITAAPSQHTYTHSAALPAALPADSPAAPAAPLQLLCSYFIMLPLREEAGISLGEGAGPAAGPALPLARHCC
jgi:hypothetical protein